MNISGILEPQAALSIGEIEGAFFQNCHVRAGQDPSKRTVLKDGVLKRCKSNGCWVNGAMIADVHVEHLTGGGRLGTWFRGCIFSNVVLRGRFGSPQWQRRVSDDPDLNHLFDANATERYASIGMALDISAATFDGLTIFCGVPPKLIRRDESRQFLLLREARNEVRSASSTLHVICKAVEAEPHGVVFTFDSKSDRDKWRSDECNELRLKGLLQ